VLTAEDSLLNRLQDAAKDAVERLERAANDAREALPPAACEHDAAGAEALSAIAADLREVEKGVHGEADDALIVLTDTLAAIRGDDPPWRDKDTPAYEII